MKKALATLSVAFVVAGCATVSNPVPENYKGPLVKLSDTGAPEDGTKARFFAVLAVDGNGIENAIRETRIASHGQGFALSARYTTRSLPVRPMQLKLIATHQTAAPIHEIASRMAGTFFSVEGVTKFVPEEGKAYEVRGELKKERSCVWVAEVSSNAPATEKICTN